MSCFSGFLPVVASNFNFNLRMTELPPTNLKAVILCGGQSQRMGSDKGLLAPNGTAWTSVLHQALTSLSLPVYVSLRADQQQAYQPLVEPEKLILDREWENVAGPLVGILSAAQALPSHHLLVVPCDMPELRPPVFSLWLTAYQEHMTTHHAVISRTTQRWQPLCGIYHAHGLALLLERYEQGQLHDQSMHAIVESVLTTFPVDIPPSLAPQFANYNTPDELS